MAVPRSFEQQAARDAMRAFAHSYDVADAARDECGAAWRDLWAPLAELGLFSVAVQERFGGAGGTLVDAAAMLEQAGAELVPGPLAATVVGGLIFSMDPGVPQGICEGVLTGALPVAMATRNTESILRVGAGGHVFLTGTYPGVDGACRESVLILPAKRGDETAWVLVSPGADGVQLTPLSSIDFATPYAQVACHDVAVAAVLDARNSQAVEDLYAIATAALCSGIARRSLEVAASYAGMREQFGEKIGRFQAIKHLCADMLGRAEQAEVLAWDAASVGVVDRPLAAAAAAALAFDAAVDNAKDCIQVLGAIGFTWEHDAHLYLRRALALRHHCGGTAQWRHATLQRASVDAPRHLHVDLEAAEGKRAGVRADLAAVATLPDDQRQTGLAESGYLAPHWPSPYGQSATTAEQLLISEEMQLAGIERPNLVIGWWAAPTILEAGTPKQLERFILPTLRGDLIWCQLFSEPGAGSDLASLRTLATRVDGGWRLNGQKVWPTQATVADWGICLARTDRAAPKHRGITYFLLDMAAPGVDVRPLRAMTGELMLNEVFLDDVFVPDDCVLGDVNDGWRLARSTLANERVEMNTGTLGGPTLKLLSLSKGIDDQVILDRVGMLVAQATANSLLAHCSVLDRMSGMQPGAEASLQKLLGVRQRQQVAEVILTLKSAAGICIGADSHEFLLTRGLSIAGGSAQVLQSLVAERMLGLPR